MVESYVELLLTICVSIDELTPTDTGCYYYLLQQIWIKKCTDSLLYLLRLLI